MNPFQYREPSTMEDVVGLLTAYADAQVIAGGIDLLGEMKDDVASPGVLLGLAGVPGLTEIREGPTGITIGGMATITAIEQHPGIRQRYTALAEAAERLATPQIRNVGTLAGNLCQRPRCWYYKNPLTPCLKRGGDVCYVLEGYSKYMCVAGGNGCYMVHPSDAAVPLVAFGADVNIAGPAEDRTMPLEEFFTGPEVDITRENALERGEVVESVALPEPPTRHQEHLLEGPGAGRRRVRPGQRGGCGHPGRGCRRGRLHRAGWRCAHPPACQGVRGLPGREGYSRCVTGPSRGPCHARRPALP